MGLVWSAPCSRSTALRCRVLGLGLGLAIGCGSSAAPERSEPRSSAGGSTQGDDPRISRSAGEEGGVVVLFPRVIGDAGEQAAALQIHMEEVARRVFPNRPLDVRPAPERVCPRPGCRGVSLGAVLIARNGQCAAVGVVGGPGPTDLTLLRWGGQLVVRERTIPFREPPESRVTLEDAVPCDALGAALAEEDYAVEEALRRAAGY